jgi:hypothetical protein
LSPKKNKLTQKKTQITEKLHKPFLISQSAIPDKIGDIKAIKKENEREYDNKDELLKSRPRNCTTPLLLVTVS